MLTYKHNFVERFDKLPESDRQEVLLLIYDALLWRGRDATGMSIGGSHAADDINKIGEIFLRNGTEIMEYT